MSVRILQGDVRDMLATLDDESVHCVVTSPPYWGLRDYGVEGQIGMEPTMGEHIDTMVDVFREIRRVLRKDGTCWLNYGDCYATSPNGRSAADTKATGNDDRTFRDKPFSTIGPINSKKSHSLDSPWPSDAPRRGGEAPINRIGGYLKPKDLCMIPNRLAIALQDDGWWVRSEIIWAKPNPMPESVTDRPATAHEKIWLLTKSARYFYDADAVRRPIAPGSVNRYAQDIDAQEGSHRANGGAKTNGTMKAVGGPRTDKQKGHAEGTANSRRYAGFNERWDAKEAAGELTAGANLRNVWTIPTKGFSGAHYATFPPDLIVPCIKAGCPVGGTVLDPFIGSGTTAMVADRLGRDCIGIDLNPANVEMATHRVTDDAGMFAEVS